MSSDATVEDTENPSVEAEDKGQQGPPTEEELFAEAFSERFGEEDESEDEPSGTEQEPAGAQADPGDEPEGSTPEPAASPPADPPVGEESDSSQLDGGEDAGADDRLQLPDGSKIKRPEWYSELPAAAQSHFDQSAVELNKLNQLYSALHGRLAPVQQENTRLRSQLETMQAQLAGNRHAAQGGVGGQSQPAATPAQDLQQSKDFAEFAEAFPDEARAIEALVGAKTTEIADLKQEVSELKTGLTSVQQADTQRTREVELNRLTEAHPDWAQIHQSPEFNNWLQYQPQSVKGMVQSSLADDCIWVLDAYKQAAYLSNLNKQPPTTPAADPAAVAAQSRRERMQQTPPSPAPSPSGVSMGRGQPGAGMSEEDLFAAEAERRARAQR